MTERPILFSAPMVRALLSGTKTQTRRVAKARKYPSLLEPGRWADGYVLDLGNREWLMRDCPYGAPGDALWVRESHWWFKDEHDPVTGYFPPKLTAEDVKYRADGDDGRKVWRPSIHMPRWASRITLQITGMRVERLQDISAADALAEGVIVHPDHHGKPTGRIYGPVQAYSDLWDQINGAGSWDANPWVWVIEFSRIEGGAA